MSDNTAEFDVKKLENFLQRRVMYFRKAADQEYRHRRYYTASSFESMHELMAALLNLLERGYFSGTPHRSPAGTGTVDTMPARTPADDGNPYRCPDSAIRGTLR